MESLYDLGNGAHLRLLTMKRSDGRITTTVTHVRSERGFLSHTPFEDYHKTVATSERGARATEKFITEQHTSVDIGALKAECARFYRVRNAKATIVEE